MVNMKLLTAAVAFASLGLAGSVLAGDTTPETTIHEESPRAGTSSSLGGDTDAMHHDEKKMDHGKKNGDDAMESGQGSDAAVHESAYKKTYPEEPEVSELDE